MPNELPDSAKYHRFLRVVFSDFLALLSQLLRHGGHLRVKVCIFHPALVELPPCLVQLLPIRPLGYLPEDISGSASSQCQAGPFGDVLQPGSTGSGAPPVCRGRPWRGFPESPSQKDPRSATWAPDWVWLPDEDAEEEEVEERRVSRNSEGRVELSGVADTQVRREVHLGWWGRWMCWNPRQPEAPCRWPPLPLWSAAPPHPSWCSRNASTCERWRGRGKRVSNLCWGWPRESTAPTSPAGLWKKRRTVCWPWLRRFSWVFSGLRMGIRNSNILLSMGFR